MNKIIYSDIELIKQENKRAIVKHYIYLRELLFANRLGDLKDMSGLFDVDQGERAED